MAENTHISWANHTFNPWIGCTKVGPACDGCYAEALMGQPGRFGPARVTWGKPGQRATHSRTAPGNWAKVRKWNREAAASGETVFVFCASLADVFDKDVPTEWRRDLFDLIRSTPNLTFLLLTKRPGLIVKLFEESQRLNADGTRWTSSLPPEKAWPRNAAIGATIVTQEEAERDIPKLLAAKRILKPAFAFLSMEPLIGPVDLTGLELDGDAQMDCLTPYSDKQAVEDWGDEDAKGHPAVDWVITGGETDQGDHKARPSAVEWFRSIRDQCAAAGVAYHHKQNGEWGPIDDYDGGPQPVFRIGKDRSGRAIDGVIHDARPEVAT